jgi:multiple sugar transport system ATP-binding protein
MTLASRIAVMDVGHIRQFAPPETTYDEPADLFVAGFIGSPPMNIVAGRVVKDGRLTIDVSDAEGLIRFPVPERLVATVAGLVGREVLIGLRPETITRQGTQPPTPELFSFERQVDVVEPTGPDTMLVFTLGGSEAIARVRPEDRAPPGTRYPFEVNMDKVKLFDPATGRRI